MSARRRVILLLRLVVLLLALQFVLGIWVNLFGRFPATSNVGTAVSYGGDPVLTVHYVLALGLVVLGVVLVRVGFAAGAPRRVGWMALGGLLSLLVAVESGVQFVLSGFSNNVASFGMAMGFIVATGFYGVAQAAAIERSTDAAASP
jgi:hypothetical protein